MDDVHRVRVVGPLEPYAAGIAAELTRLGYTLFSAREQLGLVAHLSRWLAGEGCRRPRDSERRRPSF